VTHDPVTSVDGGSGEPVAPVVWWVDKVGGSVVLEILETQSIKVVNRVPYRRIYMVRIW
jgi:hypothetical protein